MKSLSPEQVATLIEIASDRLSKIETAAQSLRVIINAVQSGEMPSAEALEDIGNPASPQPSPMGH